MALCGFGLELDKKFRTDPRVDAAFSYMACGTVPKSWVNEKPFTQAKTHCGFWAIESVPGQRKPKQVVDIYGMRRHYRPGAHLVPKVENLLASEKPDILIMQNETNLFDLFRDHKTIEPHHTALVRSLVAPFVVDVLKNASTLRRIYWVGSPIAGRVSPGVQTFILDQIKQITAGAAMVIDSRPLVPYPYKRMQPDRVHFEGKQMYDWADKVYDLIDDDITMNPLPPADVYHEQCSVAVQKNIGPLAKKTEDGALTVSAVLESKAEPISLDQLKPYQESLVAYVYKIKKVFKGQYSDKEIVVMHPALIELKPQNLKKYVVGKTYTLALRPLEGSPWETVKSSEDSSRLELTPYILISDEERYPSHDQKNDCDCH